MMSKKRPFAAKKGRRNVYCPHYTGCLDLAIIKNWFGFSCARCSWREVQETPEVLYLGGYYRLLKRIFRVERLLF